MAEEWWDRGGPQETYPHFSHAAKADQQSFVFLAVVLEQLNNLLLALHQAAVTHGNDGLTGSDRLDDFLKRQQRGDAWPPSRLFNLGHYGREAVSGHDMDSRVLRRVNDIPLADAVEKILHACAPPERSGTKL
jgi:hypothetical protein